jgi:hypothetical protein
VGVMGVVGGGGVGAVGVAGVIEACRIWSMFALGSCSFHLHWMCVLVVKRSNGTHFAGLDRKRTKSSRSMEG